MKKYVIGVDFGTLSARGVLIDLTNGAEAAVSEFNYPRGVLTEDFFENIKLESTDAFQHPGDYVDALGKVTKGLIESSGIDPGEILAVGIDFTSCTVLPVTKEGTPLCFLEEYKNNPHGYVKLWKHHSAQREADEITALAKKENAAWLEKCGGKVSAEWFFPKIIETCRKAPDIYDAADRFVEAGDWLVWQMTGKETHSSCMAGYKAMWLPEDSYPENEFWARIDKRLCGIIGTKVSENIIPVGRKAGEIDENGSKLTGLCKGTAVAAPIIDAHAALPAAGITEPGKLMMIIGTSTCHITLGEKGQTVKNICGSVDDGIVEGFCAHEAGQPATGDSFSWFVENCVTEKYMTEAGDKEKNIFDLLSEKAASLKIGESGITVLDWWGGNRTPYDNGELTGVIVGLNLKTKPEEIYRALLEATAYGTKTIVDLYEKSGVPVNEVYASGGIAKKNPFLMQLYADVLGKPIKVMESSQAGARGSAILAAAAGGYFADVKEAADAMADRWENEYVPDCKNTSQYAKEYEKYRELSEYFVIKAK